MVGKTRKSHQTSLDNFKPSSVAWYFPTCAFYKRSQAQTQDLSCMISRHKQKPCLTTRICRRGHANNLFRSAHFGQICRPVLSPTWAWQSSDLFFLCSATSLQPLWRSSLYGRLVPLSIRPWRSNPKIRCDCVLRMQPMLAFTTKFKQHHNFQNKCCFMHSNAQPSICQ